MPSTITQNKTNSKATTENYPKALILFETTISHYYWIQEYSGNPMPCLIFLRSYQKIQAENFLKFIKVHSNKSINKFRHKHLSN